MVLSVSASSQWAGRFSVASQDQHPIRHPISAQGTLSGSLLGLGLGLALTRGRWPA